MDYYITIVFNQYDDYCKLLVISNDYQCYESDSYHYKTLIHYKKSNNIVTLTNKLLIYKKDNKHNIPLYKLT